MAIELFAGTLSRYYSDVDTPEEAARTMEIVCHWRDTIIGAVKSAAPEAEAWPESADMPCAVLQINRLQFDALLCHAASVAYGKKPREIVYPNWSCETETVVQRAHADPQMNWSLLKGASWWLPAQTPVMLRGQIPTGDVVTIASTGALLLELLRINELSWKADEEEVLRWFESEGKMSADAKRYSAESLAKYAYSVFWQIAKYSLQNGVPVMMDEEYMD